MRGVLGHPSSRARTAQASPVVRTWLAQALLWFRQHRAARHPGRTSPPLVRLAAQPLTPRASVHALRWGSEEFLVACTDTSTVLIARRPAEEEGGGEPK